MNDIEEHILSYPHLPEERQREIEAYVKSNPKWAPLLRDVRSIEDLSASKQADLPDDALLATYVVVQHLHPEGVGERPNRLQSAFSELEARIESDEALRRKVEAARHRLKEAEAAIDPASHFEALTGHHLEREHEAESARAVDPESASSEAREASSSLWEGLLNLPQLVQRGAVVAVILVVGYAGLYGVSRATQSTLDRLAAVEISDQVVENYATADMRSPAPEADTLSVDDRYLEALSALRSARVSTLGLFPRYDSDALARAEKQLDRVLAQVEPGSFLALEAHFYLGKIALAQEEVDAARGHLKAVVKGESRRAKEAYEILKTLQQERGVGGE